MNRSPKGEVPLNEIAQENGAKIVPKTVSWYDSTQDCKMAKTHLLLFQSGTGFSGAIQRTCDVRMNDIRSDFAYPNLKARPSLNCMAELTT